jgi:hypothetical protein
MAEFAAEWSIENTEWIGGSIPGVHIYAGRNRLTLGKNTHYFVDAILPLSFPVTKWAPSRLGGLLR